MLSHPSTPPGPPALSATPDHDFALAMRSQLGAGGGNLFFSPFSIRAALGMACVGARGATAEQMRSVLHLPETDETPPTDFGEIIDRIGLASSVKYEFATANSLWSQAGSAIETAFLETMAQDYGCDMQLVDFRNSADAARRTINHWVENKTRGRIQQLIHPGGIDNLTRLILVNAVYFKGLWLQPFLEQETLDEPFYLERSRTVRAKLMYQQNSFRYTQAKGYQAVELPYRDSDIAMLVLLPRHKDGLGSLEQKLSTRMLSDCVAQMQRQEVELFLPRFKLTWGTVELTDVLNELGMKMAFDRGQADFSGINGLKPPHEDALYISSVLHKAFAEVNEEGTEAAAATAFGMVGCALNLEPPAIPVFRADHPFLFAIRDRKSGTLLFLGRVADPTQEN